MCLTTIQIFNLIEQNQQKKIYIMDHVIPRTNCIRHYLAGGKDDLVVQDMPDPTSVTHESVETITTSPVESVETITAAPVESVETITAVPVESVETITAAPVGSVEVITTAPEVEVYSADEEVFSDTENTQNSQDKVVTHQEQENLDSYQEEKKSDSTQEEESADSDPVAKKEEKSLVSDPVEAKKEESSNSRHMEKKEEKSVPKQDKNTDIVVHTTRNDTITNVKSVIEGNTIVITEQPQIKPLSTKENIIEAVKDFDLRVTKSHLQQLYLRDLQVLADDLSIKRSGNKNAIISRILTYITTKQ